MLTLDQACLDESWNARARRKQAPQDIDGSRGLVIGMRGAWPYIPFSPLCVTHLREVDTDHAWLATCL